MWFISSTQLIEITLIKTTIFICPWMKNNYLVVAVDNAQKIQSYKYSNCKFSLAYENYLSVFILYRQWGKRQTLRLQ